MPIRRALLALLLLASTVPAAELRTLTGEVITGDLVSISNKEIVFQKGADQVTTPLDQVLQLDLVPVPANPPAAAYTDVMLTDDTLLHCSQIAVTGNEATLTLLSNQSVTVPLDKIAYVYKEANDEKVRKEYRERFLGKKRTRDLVVARNEKGLNPLDGTLGDADAEGKTIDFTHTSGAKY